MNQALRCHARECGRQWHAICTDLDIAADGASFKDAKASLATCIELYLDGIEQLPADGQRRLLTRRAPWHVRAKMVVLTWLHSLDGDDGSSRGFVLQSGAPTPVHA